ncbi:MAG: HsdR family type I site-specific deoxyribonuclease [Methylophilaceae bacterium]|nr:HsdR family type I site-specific deoxyribonuclease [Methylophilaceae bacterium]
MSTVGQIEKATQQRVVRLFQETLGYDYLGNWSDRVGNRNVDTNLAHSFLRKQGYDDALITKALHQLGKVASDQTKSLYDCNSAVYELLRYGVKVKADVGENTQTVWLIDWKNPLNNHFAVAEEVTVKGADAKANTKRPDIVIYVNGIALGVLELKRSIVSVSEGIRQNLDNQKKLFIQPFFTTMQLVMAGNDTEGVRYGTIETPEKYYLSWKQDSHIENLLDKHVSQLCEKAHFLELIHDFVVFDAGIKKLCRHNQYFGVKAAQDHIRRREGGIIWHTQGSGKSLTMVWLAKWIRENVKDARVVVITDRTELDKQIEKVFLGVSEQIVRTSSGADLISKLNATNPWLIASLIHKFVGKEEGGVEGMSEGDIQAFIAEMKRSLPADFRAKGDIYVFVDECHRTQSGELHKAMKAILPNAMFIGFTGTPLLKADKQKSIEIFGKYIHTYKFDEAVRDKVVLDLRYEARDIDQSISSPTKIDQWFDSKTKGLNDIALAQLKKKWGSMQKVLSSKSRLEKIVADILMDFETKNRLQSGRGNAMLVTSSIYEACKCYELFEQSELAGKCAIVTSYAPSPADIKGEETGEGLTERLRKYEIYNRMLGDKAADVFEDEVKKKFIEQPGQMKLLIVVDKLLTGFDAPSATYLYIDKQMRDHGLFQAICRVNRLDGDDKEYGYIVDYKDLFKSLGTAIEDYTSGALDGYDKEDVAGLLVDRLQTARQRLEEAREAIKALCEPVAAPQDTAAYLRYFCALDTTDKTQLKENEGKRITLYKLTVSLIRAYADLASEMTGAGYNAAQTEQVKQEVDHFEKVRSEVKIASGDYIDMKMYEPAMRHLIDTYIRAEDSEKISTFDEVSLVQLIVERGVDALELLPKGIRESRQAVAETIENNLRKLIIDEQPINPKYFEKMSELLDSLILQRRQQALEYEQYLAEIIALTGQVQKPAGGADYPQSLNTAAKRALYDNLGQDEAVALAVDYAVLSSKKDGWRGHKVKQKEVRYAVKRVLNDDQLTDDIFELVKNQSDY